MSTLRHPHIVQFLGVCCFPDSRPPALVMERLLTSLHDLLAPEIECQPSPLSFFTLGLKSSVVHNIACGLTYLHERSPPVIHRDLSARNVLLNSEMVAKIADLGVAHIVPRMRAAATMTKAPGTGIYMPQKPSHLQPLILRNQNMMPVLTSFLLEWSQSLQSVKFSHVILYHLMRKVGCW